MNPRRILFLFYRYTCLYQRSIPRLVEMVFWPMMDLLVWGFLTMYLKEAKSPAAGGFSYLIGAMILWDVLFRSQQGLTYSFLEDIWSRNLINLFVAPIRLSEFLAAAFLVGVFRVTIVVIVTSLVAWAGYHFNFFSMGFSLIPLLANLLLMGWAMGMIATALIIRFGQSAEALAWAVPFLVQPFAAVFYPVSALPAWLHPLSFCLPATHVFEGMRQVLAGGPFPSEHLLWAMGANAAWFAGACLFFSRMYHAARKRGLLAKLGTQ
jgi:ABC-2 type transport system permease protein